MKAKIIITPKKAVVDPQGITVLKALEHMGHTGIKAVHVGKFLEIELDGTHPIQAFVSDTVHVVSTMKADAEAGFAH